MECWTCSEPAAATCRFCGRATCRSHAALLPYVLTAWARDGSQIDSLVVEDAVHCGACHPHPSPVRLDLVLEEHDS